MELTPLQLQIQEWSDKNLSFGCMVMIEGNDHIFIICGFSNKKDKEYIGLMVNEDDGNNDVTIDIQEDEIVVIIGHPMDYGRLCYLYSELGEGTTDGEDMYENFDKNSILMTQTVLEWDEETQILVRDFLLSLPKDE